jgi:hypothetical protein
MVQAQPKTAESIRRLIAANREDCPGYVDDCGSSYRVIHFHGIDDLPPYFKRYAGAVVEWLPGAEEEEIDATFYTTEEEFGAAFANIDILAHKV